MKSHDELVADLLEMYPTAKTEVSVRVREGSSEGRGYSNVRTSEGFVDVVFYIEPGKVHTLCETLVLCEVKSTYEKCSAGDIVRQLQRYRTGVDPSWIPGCGEPQLCVRCTALECAWLPSQEHMAACPACAGGGDCDSMSPRARRTFKCRNCGAAGECDGTGDVCLALYTDRDLADAERLILDRANVLVI